MKQILILLLIGCSLFAVTSAQLSRETDSQAFDFSESGILKLAYGLFNEQPIEELKVCLTKIFSQKQISNIADIISKKESDAPKSSNFGDRDLLETIFENILETAKNECFTDSVMFSQFARMALESNEVQSFISQFFGPNAIKSIESDKLSIDEIENSNVYPLLTQSAQTQLQEFLNGFFNQFSLGQPTQILSCIPTAAQSSIASFIPTFFDMGCYVTVLNATKYLKAVQAFGKTLPRGIGPCLVATPDVIALEKKIGKIQVDKVIAYLTTHLPSVKRTLCQIEAQWNAGNYIGAGQQSAVLVQTILGIKQIQPDSNDAQQTLQEFLNGFYNDFGLPNPTTILSCFPGTSQQSIVNFVPGLLQMACHISIGNIKQLIDSVKQFIKTLPMAQITACLAGNPEAQQLKKKIGPIDVTKVISYVTTHFVKVQSSICAIQSSWNSQQYSNAGVQAAELLKSILGLKFQEPIAEDQ